MILSVSRRTDIPNYYSEWFYNRIKEGFLYVRNPMNAHQVSEIKITPDVVDCIVFWTKNPLPMMKRLNETKDYNYYFQFTLTGYGNDVEVNLSNKKTEMIPVFQELSEKIGKQKVIWRYDPIFFSDRYTKEYHLKAFKSINTLANLHFFISRPCLSPSPRLSTPATFPGTLPRAKERRAVAFLTALRAAALFEYLRRCTRSCLLKIEQ